MGGNFANLSPPISFFFCQPLSTYLIFSLIPPHTFFFFAPPPAYFLPPHPPPIFIMRNPYTFVSLGDLPPHIFSSATDPSPHLFILGFPSLPARISNGISLTHIISYIYEFYFSTEFYDYLNNRNNSDEIMKNFAKVTIYNKRLSITKIEESPAYTLDNLFSDIGK